MLRKELPMYALNFVLVLIAPVVMLIVGLKWWFNPPAFKTGKLD